MDAITASVSHSGAGAIVHFLGAVRDQNEGRHVTRLEYSAYEPMALSEMHTIVEGIEGERAGVRVAVAHRLGSLAVGDAAVLCAASAKHRADAFWACREAIDRIKANVPIWKREYGPDGAAWVGWVDARCSPGAHEHGAGHPHEHHGHAPTVDTRPIRVVTITVSDTRDATNDASGAALRSGLSTFSLTAHFIVTDTAESLRAAVLRCVDDGVHAIVLTGGSGIGRRDVTHETVTDLFDRRIDGFGEAFRRLSWEHVGARAMLSRATAGVRGRTMIFALPGSPRAAALGASLVRDVLPHAREVLLGRPHHTEDGAV